MFHLFKKKATGEERLLTEEEQEKEERNWYFKLKAEVREYPTKVKATIIFSFISFFALLVIIYLGNRLLDNAITDTLFESFFITILMIVVFSGFLYISTYLVSIKQEQISEYELSHAKEEAEEDLFKNSIQISYTYLDQYYAQTREQARNGFIVTVSVAVLGAVLIFVGVGFLLFGDNERITPAYITCASGAITEFISAVFFYLYNKTVTSMNSYHDKLVLSQNIAFALRAADSVSEDKKDAAKLAIINELVKDVNVQMMKSDADTDAPPHKIISSDTETKTE